MNTEVLGHALGVLNPHHIIGSLFRFECEHGSHERQLVGTILAYEMSDEFPLLLTVSNKRFWGVALTGLVYEDGNWYAWLDKKEESKLNQNQSFVGTLKLLK